MDFADYLKETAGEITLELGSFFHNWLKEVKNISPTLLPLAKTLSDNCGGGKMLRGSLVKLGYEIAGGKDSKEILKPAAAVEIFQTAILAHDDIIDQSPLRRGKPTVYKQLSARAESSFSSSAYHQLGGDHYGISQTIALADIGFFLTVRLVSTANFPDHLKNKAISAFAQTVINTGLGEVLDIELPHLKGNRLDQDVLTIHKLKTSYYTIIDPLQLGAILAGADQKLLDNLAKFGEALGIAFQITDDILGVFGDEKTLGKSVTSDIEEGKNTLLITQAQKQANKEQRAVLNRYYGKGKTGRKELAAIRKVFQDTGALDYSRQVALKYVATAKLVIPKISSEPKYVQLLSQMADFLVERNK